MNVPLLPQVPATVTGLGIKRLVPLADQVVEDYYKLHGLQQDPQAPPAPTDRLP